MYWGAARISSSQAAAVRESEVLVTQGPRVRQTAWESSCLQPFKNLVTLGGGGGRCSHHWASGEGVPWMSHSSLWMVKTCRPHPHTHVCHDAVFPPSALSRPPSTALPPATKRHNKGGGFALRLLCAGLWREVFLFPLEPSGTL